VGGGGGMGGGGNIIYSPQSFSQIMFQRACSHML
jgi:hypothetical protein